MGGKESTKFRQTQRPDGTIHKEHPNILSYHNYIGKINIDGNNYYVRVMVQEEKGKPRNGLHSAFVSNIELYNEKTTNAILTGLPTRQEKDFTKVVDAKLRDFFDRAKKAEENLRKTNGQEPEARFSIGDTASTLGRNLGKEIDVADEGRREQDRYILDPETRRLSLVSKNNRTAQDAERSGLP